MRFVLSREGNGRFTIDSFLSNHLRLLTTQRRMDQKKKKQDCVHTLIVDNQKQQQKRKLFVSFDHDATLVCTRLDGGNLFFNPFSRSIGTETMQMETRRSSELSPRRKKKEVNVGAHQTNKAHILTVFTSTGQMSGSGRSSLLHQTRID